MGLQRVARATWLFVGLFAVVAGATDVSNPAELLSAITDGNVVNVVRNITLTSSLRVVDVTNLTIRSTVNATIDGGNAVQLFNITRSHVTFAGINLARGRQNEPTADGALLGGCMAVVDR